MGKKVICAVLLFTALCMVAACGISLGELNGRKESVRSGNKGQNAESEEVKESGTETGAVLNSEVQKEIQPEESAQENTQQGETEMKMKIQVEDTTFTATLAENSSVDALKELMEDGSLILNMNDYANMENCYLL